MKIKYLVVCCVILYASLAVSQNKYPSRDSKEWNDLTVTQRWQAVNIDDSELKNMSTMELIEQCVNFDFMCDIFNHANYGIGLNIVIENYNGLRELLFNRNDAGILLFNYYDKINFNKILEISKPADRGEFVAKIFFVELFLSHPNILSQFQGSEKVLISALLQAHSTCKGINAKAGKEFYSGYSIKTIALVLGRAINRFMGRETIDPALQEMDLSKLTDEKYYTIIQEAQKL